MEYNDSLELPLFLHITNPICIVIINDRIIEYSGVQKSIFYPDKLINTIHALYTNPLTKSKLPKELAVHFDRESIKMENNCLIGEHDYPEPRTYKCLDFDLVILPNEERNVLLTNITFERSPLEVDVKITASKLFYILANLCVEFVSMLRYSIEELERSSFQSFDRYTQENITIAFNFALHYLKFMQKSLRLKLIEPHEILINNGLNTLIFLRQEEIIIDFFEKVFSLVSLDEIEESTEKLLCFFLISYMEYCHKFYPLNFLEGLFKDIDKKTKNAEIERLDYIIAYQEEHKSVFLPMMNQLLKQLHEVYPELLTNNTSEDILSYS